jgi:hypothetical protein
LHVKKYTPLELHFDPTGDLLAAARDCEAEVFLRAYGNTREEIADEYGPYEDASAFVALTDERGDVVAETRLIAPSAAGLKTLNDMGRSPWKLDGYRSARAAGLDLSLTWDVATVGVRTDAIRGTGLKAAVAMYFAIVAATRANDLRWIVMIMDERARRLLNSIALPTHVLPGGFSGDYMGSPTCTPVWSDSVSGMDTQRVQNPEGHRLVSSGAGLDGISIPPPGGFVMRKRHLVPTPAAEPLHLTPLLESA